MNERQLREMLADLPPASTPAELLARIDAIPATVAARPTTRWLPDFRLGGRALGAGLVALAVLATLLAAAIGSQLLRPPVTHPGNGLIVVPTQGDPLVVDPATGEVIGSGDPRGLAGLTKQGLGFLGTPNRVHWSPDGRSLAGFVGDDLTIVDAATGEVDVLAKVSGCRGAVLVPCDLAYSPDGRTIAVTNGPDLLLVDPASGDAELARRLGGAMGSPSWSPDGRLVAVATQRAIDILDRQGTIVGLFPIGGSADLAPTDLAWSPDGTRLGYLRFDEAGDAAFVLRFVTVRPDGTDERVVATVGQCFCLGWGPPGFTWSPDGRKIAFVTLNFPAPGNSVTRVPAGDAEGGLYVANADGSDARLLRTGLPGGRPAWQPVP